MKYTEHLVLAALLAPTAAVLAAVVLSLVWPHSDVSASDTQTFSTSTPARASAS